MFCGYNALEFLAKEVKIRHPLIKEKPEIPFSFHELYRY